MKKRVRFESDSGPPTPEALGCRGSPTETIRLGDYLFAAKPFALRLHLGVLRSAHTYYACVLITAPFAFAIDPLVPAACGQSAPQLSAFVRDAPLEGIPDVCALAEPAAADHDASPSPHANMVHFLITPKEQGLFNYNIKLSVHAPDSTPDAGHLEVKIIGNSLDVHAGKPSIREGVRVFVSRDAAIDSAA
eukprot:Gregarina_sp_Pseudo_9__2708@NODE_2953_length_804_cov_2_839216_g2695_i0_p1_GENE_NODE_2953_length_804_cov_2_839216_g2695_i0NODE_2953_length_804_cov_2_839216_g2695_i0_p1_ORF_typecomplete_len191_score68_75DUF4517/PF15006_6/9_9e06_NODE_2953_length_804_cov_2_839216_g2695_i0155727